MDQGKTALKPAEAPAKATSAMARAKDYSGSTPEEIMKDIERTRARMDETLSRLGSRLKPRMPPKAVAISLGAVALGALGYFAAKAFRHRRPKAPLRSVWRNARVLEQGMLAAKLAMAARKGKPAIIVVEPRKV